MWQGYSILLFYDPPSLSRNPRRKKPKRKEEQGRGEGRGGCSPAKSARGNEEDCGAEATRRDKSRKKGGLKTILEARYGKAYPRY